MARDACTSIIVGADATTDGSAFIARCDDRGDARTIVNNLAYHAASPSPQVYRANSNSLQYTLPAGALSYWALPWVKADRTTGRCASTEVSGINSAGLVVSATETIFNSTAALTADPYVDDTGVGDDSIPSLVLPLARTAREGVQLLGQMVERMGAAEGFGAKFAEADGAWYLETASGHHWAAMRVPRDCVFATANQPR